MYIEKKQSNEGLGLDRYWYWVSADTHQYRLTLVSTDTQFSITTYTSSHVSRWLISRP